MLKLLILIVSLNLYAHERIHLIAQTDEVENAWYLILGDIGFSQYTLKEQQCIDLQWENDDDMDYQEAADICTYYFNGKI